MPEASYRLCVFFDPTYAFGCAGRVKGSAEPAASRWQRVIRLLEIERSRQPAEAEAVSKDPFTLDWRD